MRESAYWTLSLLFRQSERMMLSKEERLREAEDRARRRRYLSRYKDRKGYKGWRVFINNQHYHPVSKVFMDGTWGSSYAAFEAAVRYRDHWLLTQKRPEENGKARRRIYGIRRPVVLSVTAAEIQALRKRYGCKPGLPSGQIDIRGVAPLRERGVLVGYKAYWQVCVLTQDYKRFLFSQYGDSALEEAVKCRAKMERVYMAS